MALVLHQTYAYQERLKTFPRLTELSIEPLFLKSEKGTALNHITINGVDKLLSNGSTEVGLNGVNIIEETVLVHGDILRVVSSRQTGILGPVRAIFDFPFHSVHLELKSL